MSEPLEFYLPCRVEAAFRFLSYASNTEATMDGWKGRELNSKEDATRNSALRLIQQYLDCEMDFGDEPAFIEHADDGTEMPVMVS